MRRAAAIASLIAVLAAGGRAGAATYTGRLTLGTRADASDGQSEFFGSFRQTNPFPASYTGGTSAVRDRLARAVVAGDGYQSLRSLYEPFDAPDLDGTRYALYAVAEGRVKWDGGWSLAGRLATREISRASVDDGRLAARARNTFFVDEAYARYSRWDDWVTAALGRMRLNVGEGFVHDDYQTALKAGADLDLAGWLPLALDVQAAKVEGEHLDEDGARWDGEGLFDPDDAAFLTEVKAAYPISMLESVSVAYARFDERDGYFADLFNPLVGDLVLERSAAETAARLPDLAARVISSAGGPCALRYPRRGPLYQQCLVEAVDRVLGNVAAKQYDAIVAPALAGPIGGGRSFLNYGLVEGRKFLGKFDLAWTVAGEWGRVTLTDLSPALRRQTEQGFTPLPARIDFPVVGLLAYGALAFEPGAKLRLRAHYLFSSGDLPGERVLDGATYHSFVAVRPYVTLTNIFFSGGISENLRTGSLSPSGYYGHGVWAPVVDVVYSPADAVAVTAVGAYLHAQRSPAPSPGLSRSGDYGWEGDLMLTYAPWPWLALSGEADYFATGGFFVDMPDVWKAAAGVDLRLGAL